MGVLRVSTGLGIQALGRTPRDLRANHYMGRTPQGGPLSPGAPWRILDWTSDKAMRISKKQYEQVCNHLSRLRVGSGAIDTAPTQPAMGAGDGNHGNSPHPGVVDADKVPASTPEIIPAPSISNLTWLTAKDRTCTNKWEVERYRYLALLGVCQLRAKAFTLMLGFDCRYTPDFSYVDENGHYVFEEVKGFRRDDAMVKLRVAARMFSEFRFRLVSKQRDGWSVTEVKT